MGCAAKGGFFLLFSHAVIVPATAGEHAAPREATIPVSGTNRAGLKLDKVSRVTASTALDRVAFAVDGAESSHGTDKAMWRPNQSGPQGPMQVSEAASLDVGGGDRFDLVQNSAIGREYLAQLYTRYKNWPDAIAAYNWGIGKLDSWVKAGRPVEKLLTGVAAYTTRVLHESGVCADTETKRLRPSPEIADRPNPREAALGPSTYSKCAHLYGGRSSKNLDEAVIVNLRLAPGPLRSHSKGKSRLLGLPGTWQCGFLVVPQHPGTPFSADNGPNT
jgi:Transglycosylase SLT domain